MKKNDQFKSIDNFKKLDLPQQIHGGFPGVTDLGTYDTIGSYHDPNDPVWLAWTTHTPDAMTDFVAY